MSLPTDMLSHWIPSVPLDPIYGKFGITEDELPAHQAEIARTIRVMEFLDNFEEGISRATERAARGREELVEAQVIPPHARTHAFNDTVAHYTNLLGHQDAMLDGYSAFKTLVEDRYLDSPYWRQAESILHLAQKMLHGRSLEASKARPHRGGRPGENTDATTVNAIVYKFIFRDPKQQPYKKKKAKPQQRQQQQSTTHKKPKTPKQRTTNKTKKHPQIGSTKKTRRTISYKTATVDEMKRCKQRWMDRMHRVHMEARDKFKHIRQELDARNLKRSQPKGKKTQSKLDPTRSVPVCNPSLAGIGRKAGKPQYLIQVGAAENFYKTCKPSTCRGKGRASPRIPCVDLHGMTKMNALRELNDKLPHWIAAAMEGAYPWVMPVRIICGGGNQILSEAVANWIREQKQISNAPKELVH